MNRMVNFIATMCLVTLMGCAGSGDRGAGGTSDRGPAPQPPAMMGGSGSGGATTPTPPPPPAPSGMDAGTLTPPPSAAECTIDVTAGLPPLPEACLPRCAPTTMDAMTACTDGSCQRAALERDTTPTTTLTMTAEGMEVDSAELSCSLCFNLMNNSCVNDTCPSELRAFVTCRSSGDPCEAEDRAVGECISRNETAYRSCQRDRIPRCFAL